MPYKWFLAYIRSFILSTVQIKQNDNDILYMKRDDRKKVYKLESKSLKGEYC